ncbi:MAG: monomeric [FeFe] hydrogenase [Cloacibacillus sp.]
MLLNHLVNVKRWVIKSVSEAYLESREVQGGSYAQDSAFRQRIKKLPFEHIPPGSSAKYRCCVYKERAIVRLRVLAGLGFSVEEDDEMTSLLEYADRALKRPKFEGSPLTIIDIACKGCVNARYFVTELCQGCLARPCETACPFGAIHVVNGASAIDKSKCKNCGKCKEVCPYHAIAKISVPCEEHCPTDAIHKDENGVAALDHAKCISCGCCVASCPFGAVLERSQILDILRALDSSKQIYALTAPAIAGQFSASYRQLVTAIRELGFKDAAEVAIGADRTAVEEAEELRERMENGRPFMTTSCCHAYIQAARRHMPELTAHISDTPTPMHFTAEMVKTKNPKNVTVFIGPCVAKRKEAMEDSCVDYVMTFEELAALFEAAHIDPSKCAEAELKAEASAQGRGFAVSGGVAEAVKAALGDGSGVRTSCVNGLNKAAMARLRAYAKNGAPYDLIEVMTCPGGCVCGAGVAVRDGKGRDGVEKLVAESAPLVVPHEERAAD